MSVPAISLGQRGWSFQLSLSPWSGMIHVARERLAFSPFSHFLWVAPGGGVEVRLWQVLPRVYSHLCVGWLSLKCLPRVASPFTWFGCTWISTVHVPSAHLKTRSCDYGVYGAASQVYLRMLVLWCHIAVQFWQRGQQSCWACPLLISAPRGRCTHQLLWTWRWKKTCESSDLPSTHLKVASSPE